MPYFAIEQFAAGMDVRKASYTAQSGTLRLLRNAFINTGGEIEKRQSFPLFAAVPADTTGLMGKGALLWAVRAGGANVAPTPTTVGVQALAGLPGGVTITELLDYEQFSNKFYTVIKGSDGLTYHHYDGALVTGAAGTAIRTYRSKMYRVDEQYLRFSAVGNPASPSTGTGAGFIDLAAEDGEMLSPLGLEVYYDKMAIFSDQACQLWTVDPDPNKNTLVQTLRQAGTVAPRSVRQYGSGDILYLSSDGIRSLKARETSLTASVSDIGSPLDPYVKELFVADETAMTDSVSLLEPSNGRYWLIMKNRILVLSNYPNPKISAWSVFEPDFVIADAAVAGAFIYLRSTDNKVYRYGSGNAAPSYDNSTAEIVLPFLSFDKPATSKQYTALDVACSGVWQVAAGFDPLVEHVEDDLGTLTGPTFTSGTFPIMGHSTHISLRFRTSEASRCLINALMIHYEETTTV